MSANIGRDTATPAIWKESARVSPRSEAPAAEHGLQFQHSRMAISK